MVYISALISEYFGMTIKIYLSVIANDHGKEFFTVAIYVVAILYCILLCYILLCGSHSRLIVIVNIDIVIPEPGDHPNPNIQVIGFGIGGNLDGQGIFRSFHVKWYWFHDFPRNEDQQAAKRSLPVLVISLPSRAGWRRHSERPRFL